MKGFLAMTLLLTLGGLPGAGAQDLGPRSYVWYDGDQPRRVWVDPGWVVEFGDGIAAKAPNGPDLVRKWKLAEADGALARRLAEPQGRFSPLLREHRGSGPARALVGKVVVVLDPAMLPEEARTWLGERDLGPARRLDFAPNAYLVDSEPGLASLELANRLREESAVRAAMPDWWEEVEAR